jgi:ParB family chromosome partitioning protein
MSTKSRLQEMTAALIIPDIKPQSELIPDGSKFVETRFPPVSPRTSGSKTGPGQMLAFRGQMLEVEGQLTTLRAKLEQYANSIPAKKIDPNLIDPTQYANRHADSFTSASFIKFKDEIEQANGNIQPILVRPKLDDAGRYEIVFGHRRHRACKELKIPVLASISNEHISDLDLFAAMDRENRGRADLSNFEQGVMYQRALDAGLHASVRQLAQSLGVSHTWVNNVLSVANLPASIIESFKSPLDITHRHANLINVGLNSDRKLVLKRAEKLRGKKLSASAVLAGLLESAKNDPARPVVVNGKKIGKIERKGDNVLVNFRCAEIDDGKLLKIQEFIQSLAS